MTIEIEDKSSLEITSELLSQVPDTYQKNVGYFIWDFMRATGEILATFWTNLQYLCSFFDITKLDYDDLVKFVYQRRGLVAKTATKATGSLKVTSGSGTITIGDLFETTSGTQFVATETKTVATNDTFSIEAVVEGASSNVPIGAITVIPSTIQGIVSVTNTTAINNGYDKETKESIIERYFEDLQKPITSGNVYHYLKWAKSVVGVGNAKIKPLWNGDNTVKVVIINSNFGVASQTLIDSVQNYIDPYTLVSGVKVGWGCGNGQAPIGAYCTVASATQLNIDVSVEITLQLGADFNTTKTNIENNINSYLKSIAFNESYVSYAKIGSAILSADGVKDYDDLLVNNDNDNIPIVDTNQSTEIAVLDELTVTQGT